MFWLSVETEGKKGEKLNSLAYLRFSSVRVFCEYPTHDRDNSVIHE